MTLEAGLALLGSVLAIFAAVSIPLVLAGRVLEKLGGHEKAIDKLERGIVDQGRRIGTLETRVESVREVFDYSQGFRVKPP